MGFFTVRIIIKTLNVAQLKEAQVSPTCSCKNYKSAKEHKKSEYDK